MSPQNLIGETLGKYQILEALGRGGMAQVYKAYHAKLDRYVAIKVLRSDLVEQDEFLARFKREARAVSSLRHPAIVQVFDFDVQDDLHYMVMELLEGDTLRARLNEYRLKNERMPLPEILRIISDVLRGLAYAHGEGVIHRDIKPANIMLTRRGQAVLTDFGIAQIIGSTQYTVTGALMGTLHYMAPEQGLKNDCDQRSDIYSLGIVLYEMLSGFPPFDGDTPLAILLSHLNQALPDLHQADPNLPPALEAIVSKALQKEPEKRYQSAEEMLAAFTPLLEEKLPATPRRISPGEFAAGAVLSGAARKQIISRELVEADTASDSPRPPRRPPLTGAYRTIQRVTPRSISPISAAFINLLLITGINLMAALVNAALKINVFHYGWAFEIFLVASLLAFIGWGTQTPWMLVPSIFVFGNALLLAYTTLSGRWSLWLEVLWMLEPLIIGLAIYLPTKLHERPGEEIPIWGRFGGFALGILSLALACLIGGLAVLVALNQRQ
ncbi:MAG: hypothetical protein OHK0031_11210 [Anaerolineales bacterium]